MTANDLPTLLLATANAGKRRELERLLDDVAHVVTFRDMNLPSPDEVGTTFAENASIKAAYGAAATGLPTLADDSGLEVDALNGAPGLYSARFAGVHGDDAQNRAKVLSLMRGVPGDQRTARFRAAVAIAVPGGIVDVFDGAVEGSIATRERGDGGFGYDRLFLLPDGRTMAELSEDEKNRISHRARALARALPTVRDILESFDGSTASRHHNEGEMN